MDEPVARFEKNSREEVWFTISEWKGKPYIDIRTYYEKDGEWRPTPKGLKFSATLYKDLAASVVEIGHHLEKIGFLPLNDKKKP